MRTMVRRSARWLGARGQGSAGAASTEFALVTTAVAAVALAVTVGLEAIEGGSLGEAIDRFSQAVFQRL